MKIYSISMYIYVIFPLFLLSCTSNDTQKVLCGTQTCSNTQVCIDEQCFFSCSSDIDCLESYSCNNQICEMSTTTSECKKNEDCISPSVCENIENAICNNQVCIYEQLPENECCIPPTNNILCTSQSATCGTITTIDQCQTEHTIDCGTCSTGNICIDNECCIRNTDKSLCISQRATCGTITTIDQCQTERTINCGTCSAESICTDNECVCQPITDEEYCTQQNKHCGEFIDIYCDVQRIFECGDCENENETCTDNICVGPICSSDLNCVSLNTECGNISNACETLDCGTCGPNSVCGAGGVQNKCACSESAEEFCERLDASCGVVFAEDLCGSGIISYDCGTCNGSATCENNICNSCNPITSCFELGRTCGRIFNGCEYENCGTCNSDKVCVDNTCSCEPNKTCDSENISCGDMNNGCKTISCGYCSTDKTCEDGICIEQCQDMPKDEFCEFTQAECGSITATNDCGAVQSENCGNCTNSLCDTNTNSCCTPADCSSIICGYAYDSCGNPTICNNCTANSVCNAQTSQCETCTSNCTLGTQTCSNGYLSICTDTDGDSCGEITQTMCPSLECDGDFCTSSSCSNTEALNTYQSYGGTGNGICSDDTSRPTDATLSDDGIASEIWGGTNQYTSIDSRLVTGCLMLEFSEIECTPSEICIQAWAGENGCSGDTCGGTCALCKGGDSHMRIFTGTSQSTLEATFAFETTVSSSEEVYCETPTNPITHIFVCRSDCTSNTANLFVDYVYMVP